VKSMDGGLTPEQWVEQEMQKLDHFKIEYKDAQGKWVDAE